MMNSREIMVEVLDKVFFEGAYSNIELNKRLNAEEIDDKDKGLITEVVYGTIKYKKYLDCIISSFVNDLNDIDKCVLNILRSAIYQIKFLDRVPEYAVVNEAVNLSKKKDENLSRFVNGVLRNYLRNKEKNFQRTIGTKGKLSYEYSFDEWMVDLFLKQYGLDDTEYILDGLNQIPEVTVRVNATKAEYDDVYDSLEAEGYTIREGKICPEAIKIKKGKNIEKNPLFNEGKISVQDESAMLVAPLLDLEENLKVLDLCSAPGGKTTHVAEIMENTGEVLAFDIYEHKLDLVKNNFERLGLTNIKTKIMDASKISSDYVNYADRVLLDVPCSGLGIIRKKPEIKWNKTKEDLESLIPIQRNIMKNAWEYVKKDGIMLYSTCTLNKKENEENVDWFINTTKDAEIEKIYFGNLENIVYNDNKTATIFPNEDMDGFFIAKIRKI